MRKSVDLPQVTQHMSTRFKSLVVQDQADLQGLSKSQNRPCSRSSPPGPKSS